MVRCCIPCIPLRACNGFNHAKGAVAGFKSNPFSRSRRATHLSAGMECQGPRTRVIEPGGAHCTRALRSLLFNAQESSGCFAQPADPRRSVNTGLLRGRIIAPLFGHRDLNRDALLALWSRLLRASCRLRALLAHGNGIFTGGRDFRNVSLDAGLIGCPYYVHNSSVWNGLRQLGLSYEHLTTYLFDAPGVPHFRHSRGVWHFGTNLCGVYPTS